MVDWPMPDIGSEEAVLSPSTGDLALANAAVILIGLKKVSSVSGVPFLSDAANIALRLVNLVKDVRDNNDAFRLLGLQAGRLVWTIGIECRRIIESGSSVPQNIIQNINGLLNNLHSIETFVEAKMVRRKLKRFIEHTSDKLEVARYRDELRNALDQFAIQAGIASQQALHSINTTLQEHRVEVIFDRIHQTDTLNRLMQQQSEQMEVLHMAITNRYAEDDRMRETKEYHARVEKEQAASKAAEREYQERLEAEKRRVAEEQEKKRKQAEAEAERKRKEAEDELQRYDEAQKAKREAKRREQAEEEREMREAIAVVAMQERLEADRLRKQKDKEQEEQRKKDQDAARRRQKRQQEEEDARFAAEEAEKERQEARRRKQRIAAGKQRREEDNANATLTKTEVEITYTRKAKKSDPGPGPAKGGQKSKAKGNSSAHYKEVSREEFDRQVHRAFGHMGDSDDDDFDWDSSDSSDDDDEYWSDEAPKKRRGVSKGKQSIKAKAVARASSSRPFVDANSLSAGIHDMVMQRVNATVGGSAPFQSFRSPSPYMMPPPAPHRSRPASFAGSSSQANAVSISMNNVSNSAISFGDYPAVVRNSGNVSVVNISNVGNRY